MNLCSRQLFFTNSDLLAPLATLALQEVFHTLIDMLWENGKGAQKKEAKSGRCTLL